MRWRPEEEIDLAIAVNLGLSPRLLQVLGCLAMGMSRKEIAEQLGISPNTVKNHVQALAEQLAGFPGFVTNDGRAIGDSYCSLEENRRNT